MAYIESAYYGDERTSREITNSLRDKVLGSKIDVEVSEKILPAFEVTKKVELTSLEERKIKEDATRACGGADRECIEKTEASLRQNTLASKQKADETNEALLKGRRLTVNIIDETGKRIRKVIPDGNKFTYDGLTMSDPKDGGLGLPPPSYFQNQLMLAAMTALGALVYVFSVVATWTLFMQLGAIVAVPLTAIAVFLPYSGYVLIFLYFMFRGAINTYIGKI